MRNLDINTLEAIKDYISQYQIKNGKSPSNIGTFEKFNGEIFKQLVEKILIEGNKATFVFNNMMKITKIVK